jgi:uncharacterized protein
VRLSRFIATYRDAVPGEHVLYDVIEDRYVGVDEAGLAAISRWASAPPAEDERDAAASLHELGMVVADDAEDEARLAAAEARARRGPEGTTDVTLLVTLACNLACTYCIQQETPSSPRMSAETEEATLRFVLRKVDAARTPRLVVHYIGGEPLARKDLVLRTAARFAAEMQARGGTFEWELTTNAIGLRAAFVDELLAHGRGSVKITLDGDRETHDLVRIRRDGRGTFDEVHAALLDVARGCPDVALRLNCNFRPGQEASFERLLDRLERDGLRGRFDVVRMKPVVASGPSCTGCGDASAEADGLVQLGASVRRRGLSRGGLPTGIDAFGACEAHWATAWTIDPAGHVYRCFDVAGRPEMAIGHVGDDAVREDPLTAGRPWAHDPGCRACPFVTACYGGCLGAAYLQTGRSGTVLCRRDHFEKAFREEVVSRYLAEFHPQLNRRTAA